jgi:hypothetical protein
MKLAYRKSSLTTLLLALGLLTAFLQPSNARAARGFVTGFADLERFASANPSERATWLDRAVEARAGILRLDFYWFAVASSGRPPDPTNPGSSSYNFTRVDTAVRDAEARGLSVILNFTFAPSWAEGPDRPPSAEPGTWRPNPSDLADFMRAVAARYSGGFDPDGSGPAPVLPAVQALQVWNEPNHHTFLNPPWVGQVASSASHYREMLNASYAAIKAVNPAMRVVTAGLSPYGDPPGTGDRVRPVQFWRDALCVRAEQTKAKKKKKKGKKRGKKAKPKTVFVRTDGCPGGVNFDVLAHHPINTSGGPTTPAINPDDASSADLDRITAVLRGAESAGTAPGGSHPIWADEVWWDSNPPNPAGVPPATQARYLQQQFFLLWRDGASVAINQFILDHTTGPQGIPFGLQGGIFFADGQAKPAYTAFRFPFVTDRINKKKLLAWGKAPEAGKLKIQRSRKGRWTTVRKLRVGQNAVFTAKLPLRGKQRMRAVVSGNQSLVWNQR